jgi:hypothetical protein
MSIRVNTTSIADETTTTTMMMITMIISTLTQRSRSSSVSMETRLRDYGLDDKVSIPAKGNDGILSLRRRVQTSSGPHLASYAMDTEGSFHGGKAAGA